MTTVDLRCHSLEETRWCRAAFELDPVPLGVDLGEDGLGIHVIAFVKANVADRPFDLGRDLHHLFGLERAERLDLVDHLLHEHGSDPNHEGRPRGLGRGRRAASAGAGNSGGGQEEQKGRPP